MKRTSLFIALVLLLTGCGQSNEERAKELVKQACALEPSGGESHPDVEPRIREAVELDEMYRPLLIAFLRWTDALWIGRNMEDPVVVAQANADVNENFAIVNSYCNY